MLFNELDEDNSNTVERDEFKKLFNFTEVGRAEKFFRQIDVTGDGSLEF